MYILWLYLLLFRFKTTFNKSIACNNQHSSLNAVDRAKTRKNAFDKHI